MAFLERAGFISDLFGCALVLADIRITQGRLRDAMRTYERALQTASDHSTTLLRGTADMYVGMSGICRERNDLDGAIRHLQTSADLGEHMGLRQNPWRWRVAMAHLREIEGDLDGALDLLREAERLYVGDFSPDVRPVAAITARMLVRHGRLDEAQALMRGRGLSVDDELSYLHEFEHITLARLLIARYRREGDERAIRDAIGLLDRLLTAADEGGREGNVIEILVLQALAREARGDLPMGLASLERALSLAEPEGYVRTFIDEGPPMARLLSEAQAAGMMPAATRRLLDAFGSADSSNEPFPPEPLSAREMDVLRLIDAGLSNQQIADRLYLALDTVKGHNRRLFARLGVQRRTEAISRARELGLL